VVILSKKVLEAENVVFNYPDGTNALDGLSLSIEKGKKIAILGANGAGKSTLFLHFNGILKPKKGNIKFRGKKVSYKKKYWYSFSGSRYAAFFIQCFSRNFIWPT